MPYFAVFYDVVDDFVTQRGAFRAQHLRRVSESYARGGLVLGGALAEPAGLTLLVFLATDRKIVESFVNNDPYVTNGLVKNWEIRTWNVVTGNEASPDPIVPGHPSEIVRTWSARSTKILWPRYREHFTNNVLGELRAINGYLGATLSVRHTTEHSEILVETYWRSLDAIRAYAGIDMGNAVVAKEIVGVLTDYDHRVQHFELVAADRTKH